MHSPKYPNRANFSFVEVFDAEIGQICAGRRVFEAALTAHETDISHVRIANPEVWAAGLPLSEFDVPTETSLPRLTAEECFRLVLRGADERPLFTGQFGVSGPASIFVFEFAEPARFPRTDGIPYLFAKIGAEYVGFLLDVAYPTFMIVSGKQAPLADQRSGPAEEFTYPASAHIALDEVGRVFAPGRSPLAAYRSPFSSEQKSAHELLIGSYGGEPNLWILCGATPADLTRKMQRLIGTAPTPPAWALGIHLLSGGIIAAKDISFIERYLDKLGNPVDALWFCTDRLSAGGAPQPDAAGLSAKAGALADAAELGLRIVAPIAPGVKREPGYRMYEDGLAEDVFCQNDEGRPFVGLDDSVLPDFTQSRVRDWWAGYVAELAQSGCAGGRLDAHADCAERADVFGMRFSHGREPIEAHANDYSLGMLRASHAGFLRARPDERPFIVARSACTGSSRYGPVWAGECVRDYAGLRASRLDRARLFHVRSAFLRHWPGLWCCGRRHATKRVAAGLA